MCGDTTCCLPEISVERVFCVQAKGASIGSGSEEVGEGWM